MLSLRWKGHASQCVSICKINGENEYLLQFHEILKLRDEISKIRFRNDKISISVDIWKIIEYLEVQMIFQEITKN